MGQSERAHRWEAIGRKGAGTGETLRQETDAARNHAPTDLRERNELLRRIQREGTSCFGGRLLRHKNAYGNPYVSFMVPARESTEDGSYYAKFYALQSYFMVPSPQPICAGEFRIFTYALNGAEEESVRERLREERLDGIQILRSLIHILREYADTWPEYYPLQAISPDTVFINRKGDIRILPLRMSGNGNFPVELRTDDAGSSRADIKTDIYSAVYLAMEICAGNFDGAPQMPPSEVLTYALLPHALRPGLEEVSAVLGAEPQRGARRREAPAPGSPEPEREEKVSLWKRFLLWVRDIFEPPVDTQATFTRGGAGESRRGIRSLLGLLSGRIRRLLAPECPDEGDGTFKKGL